MADYDLIVLGTGGVGSAALFHGASRNLKCLGLDRFPPAHNRGSSHGESRMIRMSYFEHPDYVPLLKRSYQLWDELDPTLLQRSGVLYAGPENSETISGVLRSAETWDLPVERVEAARFPQYSIPSGSCAVFEAAAGWLPVERCVQTHLDKAMALGAEHRWGETVSGWSGSGAGVEVITDQGRYTADRLIIAGGAWNPELLTGLDLPLTVTRKHVHWFRCDDARYTNGFFIELEHGQYYGFPLLDGRLKLGEHSGGEAIDDPLNDARDPDPEDDARIRDFVASQLPGVSSERLEHQTCFYTMTPDADFIVDYHPDSTRVAYTAGLSGHGFKFTPALGEVLVDMVCKGGSDLDLAFLQSGRDGLRQ